MSLEKLQSIFNAIDATPNVVIDTEEILERINAIEFDAVVPEQVVMDIIAFNLAESNGNGINSIGNYFSPRYEFQDKEGNVITFPDMKKITANTITYWQQAADQKKHPFLIARYAGLVWDLTHPVTGNPVPHTYRAKYVDSCIELIQQNLFQHPWQRVNCLIRITNIATKFNDKKYFDILKQMILDIEEQLHHEVPPGTWGFAYDNLIKNSKFSLSESEEEKIIARLEDKILLFSQPDENGRTDPWGAKDSAIRLAEYYQRKKKYDDVRRVVLSVGSAFGPIIEKGSAMQAAGWLSDLHLFYLDNRLNDDAAEILKKYREKAALSAEQMSTMRQQIELPIDQVNDYISSFFTDNEGLLENITSRFIPEKKLAEEQVKMLAPGHPLTFSTKLEITDNKGRLVATVGPVTEDLNGRIIIRLYERIEFQSLFLHQVLNQGLDTGAISHHSLIEHIRLSDVISDDRLTIIAHSLEYYFAENYLVFIHLSIPQIEEAIRNLLEIAGGKVMRFKDGAYRLRTFDDILGDQLIQDKLGEDTQIYLRILFTDPRGVNLRNIVCHGLEGLHIFNKVNADRVLHVLILLGFVRFTRIAEPEEKSS